MAGLWEQGPLEQGLDCFGSPRALPGACQLGDGAAELDSLDAFLDAFAEDCEPPALWPSGHSLQDGAAGTPAPDGGGGPCKGSQALPAGLRTPVAVTDAAHATMAARMHQPPAMRLDSQAAAHEPASSTDASAACLTHASCGTPELERAQGGSTAVSRLQGPDSQRMHRTPRCDTACASRE